MPKHLPRAGKAVRDIRAEFAKRTATARADIARTMNDPDLSAEARQRRIATAVDFIETETRASLKKAREVVTTAQHVARSHFDPAVLRRKAVLADPGRAADLRGAFAGLPAREIVAFAQEAANDADDVLRFALLSEISNLPRHAVALEDADATALAAAAAKLAEPTDAGSASANADHVVAAKEMALLEHADALAAVGKPVTGGRLMGAIDAVKYSTDDHATEYGLIGLAPAAPEAVASLPPLPTEPAKPEYASL